MADNPAPPGGQKLGWWNETAPIIPVPTAVNTHPPWWQGELANSAITDAAARSEKVALEAEEILPDIGEELEEEALRRMASNAAVALVEIYARPEVMNARMLKGMLIFSGIVALWLSGEAIFFHDLGRLMVLPIVAAELAIIGKVMSNLTKKQKRPVVTMSRAGLEMHFFLQNIGLVPWDEIEEIGVFSNCGECSLGIVPKNSDALCRRLPAFEAFCVRTNSRFCRLFPKKLRTTMAPIAISARMLPMSVDALKAQIEKFRNENGV